MASFNVNCIPLCINDTLNPISKMKTQFVLFGRRRIRLVYDAFVFALQFLSDPIIINDCGFHDSDFSSENTVDLFHISDTPFI